MPTPIDAIRPHPRNPRKIAKDALSKLCESIQRDPEFMRLRPIVVDGDAQILGGNQRWKACKALGFSELPDGWVVKADDLTDEQRRRFILVDNAPEGMAGGWDFDLLKTEWKLPELKELGFDMADLGGEPEGDADAEPQIDQAEELNKKWQVKAGDLWLVGNHRLVCGDSTKAEDVQRVLDGKPADSGIADPPYNVGLDYGEATDDTRQSEQYWEWQRLWFDLFADMTARQVVTPGCVNLERWIADYKPKHVAVWDKGEGANTYGRVTKYWAWEPIMCHGKFERIRHTDVFRISALGRNPGHPCPKPLQLWTEILSTLAIGETIYEPFTGSGTTMVAGQNLGRRVFGLEISPAYCAVILQRMADAFPGIDIRRG